MRARPHRSRTNGVAERALCRAEKNGGIVRWSAAVIFGKCKTRWQKAKLHSKKDPQVQPRREASPQPLTRQVFEAQAKVETRCQAAVKMPKHLPELSNAKTHKRATQVAWTPLKNKRPNALMNDFSLCSFEALTSTQSKLAGAVRQTAGTIAIVVNSGNRQHFLAPWAGLLECRGAGKSQADRHASRTIPHQGSRRDTCQGGQRQVRYAGTGITMRSRLQAGMQAHATTAHPHRCSDRYDGPCWKTAHADFWTSSEPRWCPKACRAPN